MFKNVFCIHAKNPGGYCKNKNVKRSLLGIGARLCIKYRDENNFCEYHEKPKKPNIVPPPRPAKMRK